MKENPFPFLSPLINRNISCAHGAVEHKGPKNKEKGIRPQTGERRLSCPVELPRTYSLVGNQSFFNITYSLVSSSVFASVLHQFSGASREIQTSPEGQRPDGMGGGEKKVPKL